MTWSGNLEPAEAGKTGGGQANVLALPLPAPPHHEESEGHKSSFLKSTSTLLRPRLIKAAWSAFDIHDRQVILYVT